MFVSGDAVCWNRKSFNDSLLGAYFNVDESDIIRAQNEVRQSKTRFRNENDGEQVKFQNPYLTLIMDYQLLRRQPSPVIERISYSRTFISKTVTSLLPTINVLQGYV